jgi:predicted transcriptional regulator
MPNFTPGEFNIMQLLWEHGELKPSELQRLYPEPIKNPALRSYLTILLAKRHVARRKVGKAFVYKAVTPRQSAFRYKLRELVDAFCNGSTQSLLLNLIRSESLSDAELVELKKLADRDSAASGNKRGSRTSNLSQTKRKRKKK